MRILLLEDNVVDADLSRRILTATIADCTIDMASSMQKAKELLWNLKQEYAIALLDMRLPDGNGMDLLMDIRDANLDMAVVMLTGSGNEEVAVAALKAGADEYVVKKGDYIDRLPNVVAYAIESHKNSMVLHSEIINVLYVEYNQTDEEATRRHLQEYAPQMHLKVVATGREALALLDGDNLARNPFDVLLMDYRLPDISALELIKIIRQEKRLSIPIILITGQGNEDLAVQSLKLGVTEYLAKVSNYLHRLPSVIANAYHHAGLLRNQAALAESEAHYRLLAENTRDVISFLDEQLNYTYISPSVEKLCGFKPGEAIHLGLSQMLTAESYRRAVAAFSEMLQACRTSDWNSEISRVMELEMRCRDQTTIWTELMASVVSDEPGVIKGILGVTRDISKRKAATDLLRKLSRAVEQSPASILITTPDGAIEYANPRFSELTGYTLEEIKGQNPRILKSGHTSADVYEQLWKIISSGQEWNGEFCNKRKDGTFFWEQASISCIKNEEGAITHYLAVKEDITEKKRYEEELIKSKEKAEESDRLKTSFLHNISHEIRTPMNAIVNFAMFLQDPNISHDKQVKYTDIIIQSSQQLLSIITDIINIATVEAGQEKISESTVILDDICQLMVGQYLEQAHKQDIDLQFETYGCAEGSVAIVTDTVKLSQILSNLINNALKFTDHGSVSFGFEVQNNWVMFYVRDTGIGIDPGMFVSIFDRFRQADESATRQFGGSGLGLAISKAYVELMGGRIWVESEPGKGSVFRFTIPLKRKMEEPLEHPKTAKEGVQDMKKALRLLVAEDEDLNYILLEEIFSDAQIEVVRAANGVQAVELCRSGEPFDMILMDLKMPQMNGFEATQVIRSFLPDIPIIAQTAYSQDADRERALQCGCNDFISKPYSPDRLMEVIRRYLKKEWDR